LKTYVLYHASCWDGFCAAWIAKKSLPADTEFIPVQYGQPEPAMKAASTVYVLDFSYKREQMRNLLSQMQKVVVLDHHKTAQAELADLSDEFTMRPDLINNIPGSELPVIVFDMERSGGRLTWDYFFGDEHRKRYSNPDDLRPWLVDYTEDRDLWRWKLDWSREINAYIRSWPLDFDLWDAFAIITPGCERWDLWVDAGAAILRRESQIVDDHVRHAREIVMDGHTILAVNATVLFSEIAGELAVSACGRCEGDGKAHGADRPFISSGQGDYPGACPVCKGSGKRPFGACYFDRGDGKRQWSLRSRNEGVDVAEIAKAHGGGGHPHSAGFEEVV
jgi:uncharacterized protein